jgi:hypothetical protein
MTGEKQFWHHITEPECWENHGPLVLFLDDAPPDLREQLSSLPLEVREMDGRQFILYLDFNGYAPYGFEPGSMWTPRSDLVATVLQEEPSLIPLTIY